MSDREIFFIGVFAALLMVVHLIVNIVQFRKLGRESGQATEKGRKQPR